jgi:hypothetical protein
METVYARVATWIVREYHSYPARTLIGVLHGWEERGTRAMLTRRAISIPKQNIKNTIIAMSTF